MKDIVNLRVHIAPVGFEVDRIIIPAVRMKADKVWLIAHDNTAEDKASKYRQKIEKELEKNGIKTEVTYANRLRLFPIIKAVTEIIFKERKNDIYVNVATGSKIHAIGCMMACMLFDDRDKIHPFYAQAEQYPEYEGDLQQTYGGCGEGTVLVDGACQLTSTPKAKSSFMSIEPLYIIIGVVAIGGIIGAIAVARRGSKTPKPVKQKPKPVKQKPAKKKETSAFCENCGNTLNPKAKFCGGCGTARS